MSLQIYKSEHDQTFRLQSQIGHVSAVEATPIPVADRVAAVATLALSIKRIRKEMIKEDGCFLLGLFADRNVLELNPHDYIRWLHVVGPQIDRRLHSEKESADFVETIFNLFGMKQSIPSVSTPYFHTAATWKDGIIEKRPRFELLTLDAIQTRFLPRDVRPSDDYLERAFEVRGKDLRALLRPDLAFTPTTLEEVQVIFEYIKSIDYIAWEVQREGCFAKCDIVQEHLCSLNIDPRTLFTCVIRAPNLGYSGLSGEGTWKYHQVAGIQLPDGSQHIFDLGSDIDAPLTLSEWSKKSQWKAVVPNELEVVDLREKEPGQVLKIKDVLPLTGYMALFPIFTRPDLDASLNPLFKVIKECHKLAHFCLNSRLFITQTGFKLEAEGGAKHVFKTMPKALKALEKSTP